MTVPGPKPKPAEVAEAQGNPGHRPIAKVSLEVQPGIDEAAPDWLEGEGLAIWNAYLPRLRRMQFVKETDRQAFARYCDHLARWLKLRNKVNARGESYTSKSAHGELERINPDFAAMLRLEDKITALEDRFGLTPSARQSIMARITEPPAPPAPGTAAGATDGDRPAPSAPLAGAGSPIGMFAPRPAATRIN